jgi:hypothetical protein
VTTPVVFRTWDEDGNAIALFPTIPADMQGVYCESYMHVGQHSAADPWGIIRATRPSNKDEIEGLMIELARIGYGDLWPYRRISYKMHQIRRGAASRP